MTARAALLIDALTRRVRALTDPQGMRYVGMNDHANWRRFLRPLMDAGLVRAVRVLAKPVPEMGDPLFSSVAGAPARIAGEDRVTGEFDPGRRNTSPCPCPLGRSLGDPDSGASLPRRRAPRCTAYSGPAGSGSRSNAATISRLSAVFLHKSIFQPTEAAHWYGEDFADLRLGDKAFDAVISPGAEGERCKFIECVGADYAQDDLMTLSNHCDALGYSYELW